MSARKTLEDTFVPKHVRTQCRLRAKCKATCFPHAGELVRSLLMAEANTAGDICNGNHEVQPRTHQIRPPKQTLKLSRVVRRNSKRKPRRPT